ncbi:hypothetical protein AB0L57_19825 [Nocardia sp. NPDC052254]|uniref:hypothetical protein n=1 Tax=Nocardia sp. NPDC052254 TaxID=3155681 RepID=UPI0034121EBB
MTDQFDGLFDWDESEDLDALDTDEDPPLADDIIDEQRPRVITALPAGDGSLVLRGPGAGRTIVPSSSALAGVPTTSAGKLPTRDEALDGSHALMIVHRPHQNIDDIPRLLASILAETASDTSLGVSVRLPQAKPTAHAKWFDECAAAAVKIADPACYLLDPAIVRVKPISERQKGYAPYLADPPPSVTEVLDAQREAGANLLLSSGRALDPSEGQSALDVVFTEATAALASLSGNERLALNLTLPSQWLTRPTARNLLLDQLMEFSHFDLLYVRVQLPAGLSPFQQPIDPDLLEGYRKLACFAADEERTLLLPQTGLTGWLLLGLGATGFGAGPYGSSHAFREEKAQPRGGNIQEVERYFEPALLHAVERSVHDVLSEDPTYVLCDCPYCPTLHEGAWTQRGAKLHQLHWLGRLAADVMSGRSPISKVRRRVHAAQTAANSALLSGQNIPRHLQAWDPLL